MCGCVLLGASCRRIHENLVGIGIHGPGGTGAYMDQTKKLPNIIAISVPRARTGPIYGETDTRKPMCGAPGPPGAKLGESGGAGLLYAIVSPDSGGAGPKARGAEPGAQS